VETHTYLQLQISMFANFFPVAVRYYISFYSSILLFSTNQILSFQFFDYYFHLPVIITKTNTHLLSDVHKKKYTHTLGIIMPSWHQLSTPLYKIVVYKSRRGLAAVQLLNRIVRTIINNSWVTILEMNY